MTRTQPGRLFTCFRIILTSILPRVRRESGNFLLVESGIRGLVKSGFLGSGMQNPAEGIQNPTNNWNLGSRFHWQRIQNPVLGIRNPRRGIQNPRRTWIPLHVAKNQMLWLETLLPGLKELLLSLPRHKRCFGNTHFLVNRHGKTMFVSQCFTQILGEACLSLANPTIN